MKTLKDQAKMYSDIDAAVNAQIHDRDGTPARATLKIRDTFKRFVNVCFTQMSGRAGIKKHGQAAINALLKEFKQLHDNETFRGIYKEDLSKEQPP